MATDFRPVDVIRDRGRLVEFLCDDEWPFHGKRTLAHEDLDSMEFNSSDVASYWIMVDEQPAGLVRLLDLGDIGVGAPQFDLRISSEHRGRGLGKHATRWIVEHFFSTYPHLHRIEACTRHDNIGMQRSLARAGFSREGQLRDSWRTGDGRWLDSLVYGILRRDFEEMDETPQPPPDTIGADTHPSLT